MKSTLWEAFYDTLSHNNCMGTDCDTEYSKSKADDDNDGEVNGWSFKYCECHTYYWVKKQEMHPKDICRIDRIKFYD